MPENIAQLSDITQQEPRLPNTTLIPTVFFDEWMAVLRPSAFCILIFLSRRKFGWGLEEKVSVAEIEKGTSLSKRGILNCLDALIKFRLVEKLRVVPEHKKAPSTLYQINMAEMTA